MINNKNRKNSWRRKINKKNIADQNDKIDACERLARDYNVSKVELLLQYEKFKREHSNGEISKEKFLLEEKERKYLFVKQILTRSHQHKRTPRFVLVRQVSVAPPLNPSYDIFRTSNDDI